MFLQEMKWFSASQLKKEDIDKMIVYAEKFQRDLFIWYCIRVVGSGIMSMGTGNFAYRFSRMVPEVCAGFVNFIFNHIIRIVRPK